jgi:hypothetical protein
MEWWTNNWGNLAGVVGVLLAILGVYLTVRSWKRKAPTYVIRSNNVFKGLENTIPDVEVKFPGYGQPVTSITITKIGFWNAGTETIKKNDVVKDDPIMIRAKDGVVFLSAAIIEAVNPLNKIECTVSKDRSFVSIAFDYLDCNQGAIIQVFHTGTTDADITMSGTIMGASKIRRFRKANPDQSRPPLWFLALFIGVLWILLGILASGVLPKEFTEPQPLPAREPSGFPIEVAFIVVTIATTVIITIYYLTYVPKPFSKVHDK